MNFKLLLGLTLVAAPALAADSNRLPIDDMSLKELRSQPWWPTTNAQGKPLENELKASIQGHHIGTDWPCVSKEDPSKVFGPRRSFINPETLYNITLQAAIGSLFVVGTQTIVKWIHSSQEVKTLQNLSILINKTNQIDKQEIEIAQERMKNNRNRALHYQKKNADGLKLCDEIERNLQVREENLTRLRLLNMEFREKTLADGSKVLEQNQPQPAKEPTLQSQNPAKAAA